jgi:hypothetical protein
MAALRTAASLATLSHCGVPKLAASPQLKPIKIHTKNNLNKRKVISRKRG